MKDMARPIFRLLPSGELRLVCTPAAKKIGNEKKGNLPKACLPPAQVRSHAIQAAKQRSGNPGDKLNVLGEYLIQFGKYKGQSFKWMLENDLGYTVWLMSNICNEVFQNHC
ncbi:uncharacterized protein LOC144748422 [Ciona intestinalis]